jgi:antitoxin (DNA-binding transcriptional repressor) of toxin-antitoxin stability system
MKTVALAEARSNLEKLFEQAQAGTPVLLVHDGQLAKLERIEPPEFGGDLDTLKSTLLGAVRTPHASWTPKDLEDLTRRVRERRGR